MNSRPRRAAQARGIAALRRLTQAVDGERCGLCAQPLAAEHAHLIEPSSRRLECACGMCAVLFDGAAPAQDPSAQHGRRLRRIGKRITRVATRAVQEAWGGLDLPVNLAFFVLWTSGTGTPGETSPVATSPSPLGMVDHAVRVEQREALLRAHPAIAAMLPDIEGLLVRAEPFDAVIVPIDRCFALSGQVRSVQTPLAAGPTRTPVIDDFFAQLGPQHA